MVYVWEIRELDVAKAFGDKVDVVRTIHYRLSYMQDGSTPIDHFGGVTIALPQDGDAYTAFEDITEQWCIDRIHDLVDVDGLKRKLAREYEDRQTSVPEKREPPFMASKRSEVMKRFGAPKSPLLKGETKKSD